MGGSNITAQITPFICFSLVTPAIFVMILACVHLKIRAVLSILFFVTVSAVYLLLQSLFIVYGVFLNNAGAAVQLYRFQEIMLLFMLIIVPFFVQQSGVLSKIHSLINTIFFFAGTIFTAASITAAFLSPGLFIPMNIPEIWNSPEQLLLQNQHFGLLVQIRDIVFLVYIIYLIISCSLFQVRKQFQMHWIVIIGFYPAAYLSLQEIIYKSTGHQIGVFNNIPYQRFNIGLVILSIFSFIGILQSFLGTKKKMEADTLELKKSQKQLEYLANNDSLTGVGNRRGFFQELETILDHEQFSYQDRVGLLMLDLDGFQDINSSYGSSMGDTVLVTLVSRLKQVLAGIGSIFRTGGDEFIILFPHIQNKQDLEDRSSWIQSNIGRGVDIDNYHYDLTASIGALLIPDDGKTLQETSGNLFSSLNSAKKESNTIVFFSRKLKADAIHRISIVRSLRESIRKKDFHIAFQPIVTRKKNLVSMEALLRWQPKESSGLSPEEFVPIAESAGLMIPISSIALDIIFEIKAEMNRKYPNAKISVNLSPLQLTNNQFIPDMMSKLNQWELGPEDISFEITENTIMQNVEQSIRRLSILKEQGFEIALDDFGSGYSSLSYLRMLPIDRLKIDKSFLVDVPGNHNSEAIVKAIMDLSREFQFSTTAEGIEREEQFQYLKHLGCECFQGYLIGRPMNIRKIERRFYTTGKKPAYVSQ